MKKWGVTGITIVFGLLVLVLLAIGQVGEFFKKDNALLRKKQVEEISGTRQNQPTTVCV